MQDAQDTAHQGNMAPLGIARLLAQLLNPAAHAAEAGATGAGTERQTDPLAALLASLGILNGNPGDYVNDQRTLDDLLSQLMDQTRGGTAGVTDQQVDALPMVEIFPHVGSSESALECAICQDEFIDPKDPSRKPVFARQLPCEHRFHDECIRPWLTRNGTCPICRKSVWEPQHEPLD